MLFCVFSYNRPQFLQNLLASIETYFPRQRVAVFDDQSDDPQLLSYYNRLENKPGYTIHKAESKGPAGKHGGLYQRMNQALDYCRRQGSPYAFFMQDDMQFVRYADLLSQCDSVFAKWENALMFSPLFMQKIYLPEIDSFIEKRDGDLLIKGYGIADVGIIGIDRAVRAGLRFDARGERFNGHAFHARGHVVVLAQKPCLAWVPWASAFRKRRKKGFSIYKNNTLFIELPGEQALKKLNENEDIPFLEDFARSARRLPKPYFYKAFNFKEIVVSYFRYIKHKLAGRRG